MRPSTARTITLVPRVAASRTASLPELAADLDLALGPKGRRRDSDLADQRIDPDRRLAPLRPPDEEPGLGDVENSGHGDRDEPPWRGKHEDRECEGDEDEHDPESTFEPIHHPGAGSGWSLAPSEDYASAGAVSSRRARGGASGDAAGS